MDCPCGEPVDPRLVEAVEAVSAGLPLEISLETAAGTWLVPRIFIAHHGIKAREVPELAERYGWERVAESRLRRMEH